MAPLKPKVPFWVLPCPCWNPNFLVFGDFVWAQRKVQKQIVATKMRSFLTFRTQIVFSIFLQNASFANKDLFSSQPPKNTIFNFFEIVLSIFHLFSFALPNIKKTKTKRYVFWSPFFDSSTTCKKIVFAPLHTICVFRYPQNTVQLGNNKQNKSWTDFWLNLGQIFDPKRPNLGQTFEHACDVRLGSGPIFANLKCWVLDQFFF